MASGSTITLICNQALGSVGTRSTIASINENSQEAIQCNLYFSFVFRALARTAKWGCLKKQAPLSLVLSAPGTPTNPNGTLTPYPPNPWNYSYLIPSDSLFIRQLIPPRQQTQTAASVPLFPVNNYVSNVGDRRYNIPYEIGYGVDTLGNNAEVINTNLYQALADYTVNQQNPQFWDSLFEHAMVSALAVFLAPALTLDKALMAMCRQTAESLIMQARTADGNENPISQDRDASWISARNGESGAVGFNNYAAFPNMPWPSY